MELLRNLAVDTVARLRPAPPRRIDADRTVADAVDMMRTHKVGCLLVVRDGALVGIFTERDLLKRVLAVGKPLTDPLIEATTEDPVTVRPGDSIGTALERMQEGGYRHLPVVDAARRPVGVISAKGIAHYLVEHFPNAVYTQSLDPHRFPDSPEGA